MDVDGDERSELLLPRLFRALFTHMAEAVAVLEITRDHAGRPANYRFVEVNAPYEGVMDLPRERLVGRLADEVFPGEAPRHLDMYAKVALEGQPARLETHCQNRHYEISIAPLGGSYIAIILFDVTAWGLQEKALRDGEWFLERSQLVGRLGSYRLHVASGVWDSSHGLDDVFGIDASFTRDVAGWLSLVHPEDRDVMARYFAEEVLGKGKPFDRRYRIVRRRDGEVRWMHGRGELEKDAAGTPLFMIGTIQDITEAVEREAERQRLQQQLLQSQKMESVGLLAGGVAHDFNNLLTVILGCTEEVVRRLGPQNEALSLLVDVGQAAQRAAELTRQLLAFSRRQVLQPRALNLNAVVAGVSRMLRRMLGEQIRLEIVAGHDVGPTFADPGQLEQIIVNLAVNARDAMPAGGTLTFETANAPLSEPSRAEPLELSPGSYVMLAVHDTGLGMDEATRARVFEPFFTTKGETGTGLGLATVYGIVKQSGGQIVVSSRPGSGTTFKVYLPRAKADATSAAPVSSVQPSSGGGHETILLVEDEALVRTVLKKILAGAGYEVLEAANAEEAAFLSARFDGIIHCVLTDVVMPGKTGPELCDQLLAERPELKVIYMSGYAPNASLFTQGLESGIAFIQKPITPALVLDKLREVLRPTVATSTSPFSAS